MQLGYGLFQPGLVVVGSVLLVGSVLVVRSAALGLVVQSRERG